MSADGSDAVNVSRPPGLDLSPTWSPDGLQLAFTSQRDRVNLDRPGSLESNFGRLFPQPSDIFVMDALGGAATNLTSMFDADYNREPSWSPVGNRILFAFRLSVSLLRTDEDLFVVDASGGVSTGLNVESWGSLHDPSWSPDGASVLFASLMGFNGDYKVVGPDWDDFVASVAGGTPVNLTQTPGIDWNPVWWVPSSRNDTGVGQSTWGEVKARFRRVTPRRGAAD